MCCAKEVNSPHDFSMGCVEHTHCLVSNAFKHAIGWHCVDLFIAAAEKTKIANVQYAVSPLVPEY